MDARHSQSWDYQQFRMYPTVPASTRITVTGGRFGDWGNMILHEYPTCTFDIGTTEGFVYPFVFSNAGWYTFVWLAYTVNWTTLAHYLRPGDVTGWFGEYATAVAAEQAAMAHNCDQLHNWPPWDYGIPIGCLVLKNNGNTTLANQILPIQPVNCGQSYILRTYKSTAPRNVL